MRPALRSTLLFLWLALGLGACSRKDRDAVAPLTSVVGRWDLIQGWEIIYAPDGRQLSRYDFPASEYYYVFLATGEVELYNKTGVLQKGQYEYDGGTQVTMEFDNYVFRYDITAFTAKELNLIEDTRNDSQVPEIRRNEVNVMYLRKQ
jgi:hypothetical protein